MQPLILYNYISKLKLLPNLLPISTQMRWKKIPTRKPRCLPMSPYKVFRIPKHPYVPPDELDLRNDLLDEYYIKLESLRKHFQEELKLTTNDEEDISVIQQKDEEQFKLLLEENKRENERVKIIREQTLEREFQEQQLKFLQMAEEKRQERERTKARVENIIMEEKEKNKAYINLENIDEMIEKAIDNPVNLSFCLSVDGTIKWEGKPSLEYENDVNQRISEAKKLLYAVK